MKTFNYLLLCIVAFVASSMFVSCEKCGLDETIESSSANTQLVGTWKSANGNYLVICENGAAYEYAYNNGVVEGIQKYSYSYTNGTLNMVESSTLSSSTMNIKSLTNNQLIINGPSSETTYDGVSSGPCSLAYLDGNCQK